MKPLIKLSKSEYLTGDADVPIFVERFVEFTVFGIPLYRKIEQTTDITVINRFSETKRKSIGF